tara:strand:- start:45 stop:791 length:747 start_codon:yes stop_codon:yes gene_type:complete
MDMIYKNQYGEITFWDIKEIKEIENLKRVAVTLSGGVDSSFVMFMLCEKIKEKKLDIEVMPFTGIDKLRPTNEWYAREISSYFKSKYPEVKFLDHYTFKYDHSPGNTLMKRRAHAEKEWYLYKEQDVKVFLCGKSANPPLEESEKYGLHVDREEERDTDLGDRHKIITRVNAYGEYNRWIYRPLAFQHKKFIAQCYRDNNLIDDLFPLTASCISYADKTDYFTKPCKTCWWCKEKHWAFGMYDGGLSD